jgi:hypothetical protein
LPIKKGNEVKKSINSKKSEIFMLLLLNWSFYYFLTPIALRFMRISNEILENEKKIR